MTYPLGEDPLDGKPCEKCQDYATNCAVGCDREGDGHDSDCATHDAPAYPKGACDCSAQDDVTQYNPWRAHIYAVMEGGSYFGAQDWNDLLAYMDSEHKKILNLDDQVQKAADENKRLRGRCHPSEVVMIGDTGHYTSRAVAAEIERLRATLTQIYTTDWRKWDEEVRSEDDFIKWAKSRACHALTHNAEVRGD